MRKNEIKDEEVNNNSSHTAESKPAEAGGNTTSKNALLWKTAAQISTFNRAGIPFSADYFRFTGSGNNSFDDFHPSEIPEDTLFVGKVAAPAALVYDWVPTLGVATDRVASVNMAFKALYSQYRKVNTGSSNAIQAPDLAAYVLAMESAFSAYYAGLRVLGLLNQYMAHNAYSPRVFVEACGFDYDDMIMHQPNLIGYLNIIGRKLTAFYLPAAMPAISDHVLMNTVLFVDGDSEKAQRYIFRQATYLSYEVADQAKGLKPVDVSASTRWKFTEYVDFLNTLVDALMTSSDISLISGGFERLFGDSGKYPILLPDYTYETPTMKSDSMLNAINNAVILPVDTQQRDSYLIADTAQEYFTCTPRGRVQIYSGTTAPTVGFTGGVVNTANFVEEDPSPETVAEALRFHPKYRTKYTLVERDEDYSLINHVVIDACGSEILTNARIIVANLRGMSDKAVEVFSVSTYQAVLLSTISGYASDVTIFNLYQNDINYALSLLASFDWHHPVFKPVYTLGDGNQSTPAVTGTSLPYVDFQNLAPLSDEVLQAVHDARMYINYFTF